MAHLACWKPLSPPLLCSECLVLLVTLSQWVALIPPQELLPSSQDEQCFLLLMFWGWALPQEGAKAAVGASQELCGRRRLCCVMNCSEQQPAIFIGHDQLVNSESSLMQGSGSQQPPAPHPELLLIQGTFDSELVGRPTSPAPQHTNLFSSLQQGERRHFPPAGCKSSLPAPACYYHAAGSIYKRHLCLQRAWMAGPGFVWEPGRTDGQRAGPADPKGCPQPHQSRGGFLLEDVCSEKTHFTGCCFS